jgi:hypothetical protein
MAFNYVWMPKNEWNKKGKKGDRNYHRAYWFRSLPNRRNYVVIPNVNYFNIPTGQYREMLTGYPANFKHINTPERKNYVKRYYQQAGLNPDMIYITARNILEARRKDQEFQFKNQLRQLQTNIVRGKFNAARLAKEKNEIQRKYNTHEKVIANWAVIMNIARNMMPKNHQMRFGNANIRPLHKNLKALKSLIPVYSVRLKNFKGRENEYLKKLYRPTKVINYFNRRGNVRERGQNRVTPNKSFNEGMRNWWVHLNRTKPNIRRNAPARSPMNVS